MSSIIERMKTVATEEPRIRLLFLTGSRANPAGNPDRWSNTNFLLGVEDPVGIIEDSSFYDSFGPRIFEYHMDRARRIRPAQENRYRVYMIFPDHEEVELTICPVGEVWDQMKSDSLLKPLVDKDQVALERRSPTDVSYRTFRPVRREVEEWAEEFYFRALAVAKDLFRNDLFCARRDYAKLMEIFDRMLEAYVASRYDFSVNLGKGLCHLKTLVDAATMKELESLTASSDRESFWSALMRSLGVFRKYGLSLSETLHFEYPREMDRAMTAHIRKIHEEAHRP